jgi:photosystem II stability/assembly factor-like uncharacterized protein
MKLSRLERLAKFWAPLAILGTVSLLMQQVPAQAKDAEPPRPLAATMRDDAALSDVFFIERAIGWAVGDRGVILHTRDAGTTWQQQTSPVECSLKSVFFLDAVRGWAVGGVHKPFSPSTSGIVLRTADGGTTWTVAVAAEQGLLPALRGVRFFNSRQGVAFGAASPPIPSGVFTTHDGGLTWHPLSSSAAGDWLAGDFLAPDAGAVAGPNGRFAMIAHTEVIDSPLATGTLRSLRAMRLVEPTGGWLVGDGGLVATTNDLGRRWQTPPGALPGGAADLFDFRAISVIGSHVWIAGSPGSQVFHSADGGATWQAFATGIATPLSAIVFVDERHGWAAGALGVILATQDGGRTWQEQRSGGKRAALLGFFGRANDVPLELLAEQGAAEGYLAAIDVVFRASPSEGAGGPLDATAQDRARDAMLLSGATSADTAWRFPLPPNYLSLDARELAAALNRANDGRALERLVSRFVRQLRTWRPDVVVTHHGRGDLGEPVGTLVQQAALGAIAAAADSQQFPELVAIGLAPWQVKRIYGLLPSGAAGVEKLSTGQFSPQLGATLADWSAPARRLVHATDFHPPDKYEFDLLTLTDGAAGGDASQPAGRGLLRGIALSPGGEARRQISSMPAGNIDEFRRLAMRKRHLQELLDRSEGNAAWAAQISHMTEGLAPAGGGELMFQLGKGYRTTGRLDLAADSYYLLARTYPDHPLAEQALRWLVQFYASSEAATRLSLLAAGNDSRQAQSESEIRNPKSEIESGVNPIRQASTNTPLTNDTPPTLGLSRDERLRRTVELGKYLETARPALYAEPAVRFSIVSAERQLGFANPAKRYFLSLKPLPETDSWRRCAMTEQWLDEPSNSPPPKVLGHCRPAARPPHLDGKLDEPLWATAEVLPLGVANGPLPVGPTRMTTTEKSNDETSVTAGVRLVYDQQFLYLAAQFPKIDGGDYRPDDRPRPRDADLSAHDRVALRFDADRDYASHFELVVDHRGWTAEVNWSDSTWDPNWYVAAAADDVNWTIEAAIPLAELTTAAPSPKQVWALAVRRTIPRVGFESWANGTASDDNSPNLYGLLIFD